MSTNTGTYYKFYHYEPSLAAAIIFTIIFGVFTVWHLVLVAKHRTWFFIPVVVGGLFEIVGYTARGVSHGQATNLTLAPYVIQTLLLLIAPPLFAASLYMTLCRMIALVDVGPFWRIKYQWLVRIFVTSDVICFLVQLGGAGLMASTTSSTSSSGAIIVLIGLLFQILGFMLFMVIAVIFNARLNLIQNGQYQVGRLSCVRYMSILYIAGSLILIRSIVRVAEFAQGFHGYIILHEVFLYVFDAIPMLAVVVILAVWYPATFFMLEKVAKAAEVDMVTLST